MSEESQQWEVSLYRTASGRVPLQEFFDSLSVGQRAKLLRAVNMLREAGLRVGPPWLKKIAGGLWELRVEAENAQLRVLFWHGRSDFVLLHGLKKKRQKLTPKDLQTARKRLQDYLARTRS